MRRGATLGIAVALFAVAPSTASLTPVREHPIHALGARYGDAFRLPPPPRLAPEERAGWILARPAQGRSPNEWIEWSRGSFVGATPSPRARADLAIETLRLGALAGAPQDPARVGAAAAGVPEPVRSAFASLVSVVADAYAAQLPVARAVRTRLAGGFDPRVELLTNVERDAAAAHQAAIVRALERFRADAGDALRDLPRGDGPIFSDDEGLVILGGTGDDTYERGGLVPDPVLLVDPAGGDTYHNSAGGACPVTVVELPGVECNGLALSVVADLGVSATGSADDEYAYDGVPSVVQGAGGFGGIGLLVDVAGNDAYEVAMTRGDGFPLFNYVDGGGQGYGYVGVGALVDLAGDDRYRFDISSSLGHSIWAFAHGFGGGGGLGLAIDADGADRWLTNGLGLVGEGFEGLYPDGTGFYGGVGILADLGADDDVYRAHLAAQTVDYYAQGFGAFGGVGILYEDGGSDDYYAVQEGSDPWIDPLLNCAFGTASFGGVGVMLDLAGDDVYYGASRSPRGATVMDSGFGGPGQAYGLFVDTGGDDTYTMETEGSFSMIAGRGLFEMNLDGEHEPLVNTFGTFVDVGGTDTYVGGHGENDSVWTFGVDRGP